MNQGALDILGLSTEVKTYWARLPRRQGLDVFSDSEKYHDGRPGTKNGVRLTYEEVEAELGLHHVTRTDGQLEIADQATRPIDLDLVNLDSDVYTSESEAGHSEKPLDDSDHESEADDEDTATRHEPHSAEEDEVSITSAVTSRKRALSPTSFVWAADAYLERLDQQAN